VAPDAKRAHAISLRAAGRRRDASWNRIRRVTRAAVVAGVAGVAAVGMYVSKAFPGHQAHPASATSGVPALQPGTSGTPTTVPTPTGAPAIAPPTTVPVQTSRPPAVSSGVS